MLRPVPWPERDQARVKDRKACTRVQPKAQIRIRFPNFPRLSSLHSTLPYPIKHVSSGPTSRTSVLSAPSQRGKTSRCAVPPSSSEGTSSVPDPIEPLDVFVEGRLDPTQSPCIVAPCEKYVLSPGVWSKVRPFCLKVPQLTLALTQTSPGRFRNGEKSSNNHSLETWLT